MHFFIHFINEICQENKKKFSTLDEVVKYTFTCMKQKRFHRDTN